MSGEEFFLQCHIPGSIESYEIELKTGAHRTLYQCLYHVWVCVCEGVCVCVCVGMVVCVCDLKCRKKDGVKKYRRAF